MDDTISEQGLNFNEAQYHIDDVVKLFGIIACQQTEKNDKINFSLAELQQFENEIVAIKQELFDAQKNIDFLWRGRILPWKFMDYLARWRDWKDNRKIK